MEPIDQIMCQMDTEGRIVFQSTIMAGYSARQALYNAFGLTSNGDEIDTLPIFYPCFKDEKLNKLFMELDNQVIEDAFWRLCENERI